MFKRRGPRRIRDGRTPAAWSPDAQAVCDLFWIPEPDPTKMLGLTCDLVADRLPRARRRPAKGRVVPRPNAQGPRRPERPLLRARRPAEPAQDRDLDSDALVGDRLMSTKNTPGTRPHEQIARPMRRGPQRR